MKNYLSFKELDELVFPWDSTTLEAIISASCNRRSLATWDRALPYRLTLILSHVSGFRMLELVSAESFHYSISSLSLGRNYAPILDL